MLPTDVAVELLHAAIQRAADVRSLGILFLKGPAASLQGLRPKKISSDVDVLVDSDHRDALAVLLADWGFTPRPRPSTAKYYAAHATSFIHPHWPVDVDIHTSFPGLLASDRVVFQELSAAATTVSLANYQCRVPSRAGSALVLAAHDTRTAARYPERAEQIARLAATVRSSFDSVEKVELATLAPALGAARSLSGFLSLAGIDVDASIDRASDSDLSRWVRTEKSGHSMSSVAVNSFGTMLRKGDLRAAARVVWPSNADIELALGAPSRPLDRLRYRGERLWRAASRRSVSSNGAGGVE